MVKGVMDEQTISKIKYPHLERIYNLHPNPEILLGQEIFWTEKRDGSNIGAYLTSDGIQLRSRNQDKASEDFYKAFASSEQSQGVLELLQDAPNWGNEYVIFGEMLTTGKSPTRIEVHEKNEFVVFDIWDCNNARFMNYNGVYQHCHHFGIPVVELYGTCNVVTVEALYAFKDQMLEKAKDCKREGVVGKSWGETLFNRGENAGCSKFITYFKEKNDLPALEKIPRSEQEGCIQLPTLPDSEIYGAIEKARTDLGNEKFREIRVAMPLIAQYISEECKKHNSSSPRNMHKYYQQRLQDCE
jgi:hypothetical protein